MKTLRRAWSRLWGSLIGSRREPDLDQELATHLAMQIEENVRAGMPPEEARRAALLAFGGVTNVKERIRDQRGLPFLEGAWTDVRYAARTLRKAPGFTAVTVLTLALGIGGTAAVFSVFNAVLIEPLPYESPGQLVRVYQQLPNDPSSKYYLSGAYFKEVRDRASGLENIALIANYGNGETGLDLVVGQQANHLRTLGTTGDYFDTLRSGPLQGPGFGREQEDGERVVVLSDRIWRARFRADRTLIGQSVRLGAEPYRVVGIAPAGLADPLVGEIDAWVPYNLANDNEPENYGISAVARLRKGVTLEQARAEITALSRALSERWPSVRRSVIVLDPLKEDLVGRARPTLNALTIAVGLLLVIACLNIANLFSVRATGRVREFAVRSALGSGGLRIARQLLTESALLAVAGGVCGLVLAGLSFRVLRAMGSSAIPRLQELGMDPLVLAVTAAVTLATGFAFGIFPALRLAHMDPRQALHRETRTSTGDRRQGRMRSALVVLQVAFALTLVAAAGILMTSFYRLQKIDLGFQADDVMTFEVSLPSPRYDATQRAAFQEELARRIGTIPGVADAGATSRLPATGSYHPWPTRVLSGSRVGNDFLLRGQQRVVSGDFLKATGIPLLAGRYFDARDDSPAPARAIVSASAARQAFPGMSLQEVLGQRIRVFSYEREIVGVAGDVALDTYGTPMPTIYHAHRQFADNRNWALTHVVATRAPAEQVLSAIQAELATMDRELVMYNIAPLSEIVGRGVARERFALLLMGAFAFVALALASLGLYGVLAYSVRQRSQEIGIRMALGATAGQVRSLILRQAGVVIAGGIAIGIGGALAMGRWLASLLYETSPNDPRVLGVAVGLLIGVALGAAWLPAWRASRLDPAVTMHED